MIFNEFATASSLDSRVAEGEANRIPVAVLNGQSGFFNLSCNSQDKTGTRIR